MPAPQPANNWLGAEWNRFRDGVANLDPNSAENVQNAYLAEQLRPDQTNYVSMPWENPFFVYPGNTTPEERAAMRDRMLGAPDREIAGSWGRIMNSLDNVQDVVVTVGLLGHLGLWLAPRALGFALPGVGTFLLLADLLAALTFLAQVMTPIYATLCLGLNAGLAALVPALLFGAAGKGRVGKILWNQPASRAGMFRTPYNSILRPTGLTLLDPAEAYARRVPRFGRAGAIGLAIQLPQATATIFGYGVALGGIVGTISGGAAGAVGWINGRPVNGQWSGGSNNPARGINRPLWEDHPADLLLFYRCAAVMATVPTVLRYPDAVPPSRYFSALTALHVAHQVVYRRLHGYPLAKWLNDSLDVVQAYPAAVPLSARAASAAMGVHTGDPLPWDLPGNPIEAAPIDWVNHVGPKISDGVTRWLRQNQKMEFAAAAGQIVNDLAELSWQQLLNEAEPIRWELEPDAALLEIHARLNRVPAMIGDLQRLWSYWQAARAEHARRPVGKWTSDDLDRLAAAHGVTHLKLGPPDMPWPEEWVRWFADQRHNPRP